MKGLFITGTDTNVGKTYIACQIAAELKSSGINVVPRKPVESGCQRHGEELIPLDAASLKQAAGYAGDLQLVCPYRFEQAISPQRAAQLNDQPLHLNQLITACTQGISSQNDFLLVEGAGGFYSPLCEDGLNADLAQALNLPVLLVAEDKLGCINQVLLSVEAVSSRNLSLHSIILNSVRAEPEHDLMNNLLDLTARLNYPVSQQPYQSKVLNSKALEQLLTYPK